MTSDDVSGKIIVEVRCGQGGMERPCRPLIATKGEGGAGSEDDGRSANALA